MREEEDIRVREKGWGKAAVSYLSQLLSKLTQTSSLPPSLPLQVYDTKAKPTYLKAPSDGVVTALGLGGLTLVFIRTMSGFGDMALGVNKVEIQ
jgi:hypothetical protein